MKERILLFIPAYNCEKQIVRVLDQIDKMALLYIDEVVVINNRSTDNTEQAVLEYQEAHKELPLKLLRNKENYGLGGSHKVAFRYAKENGFDYVCVLHGDDQGNLRDFVKMFRKGTYKRYDCVLGARFMRGSKLKGYSLFRTVGNIVYNFIFAAVLDRKIYDLGSGLNIYSTKMLEMAFYKRFPDNLMFNYCMMMATVYYGFSFRYYPISWSETDQVSNVKMGKQAIKVLQMLFEYALDRESIMQDYRDEIVVSYEADEIKAEEAEA